MKKAALISLIILFAVTLASPAAAAEDSELAQLKAVDTDSALDSKLKKMPRAKILWGELAEIKGSSLPTELVVKLSKVRPKKFNKAVVDSSGVTTTLVWDKGQTVTVKVDNKTRFVRRYWGKSSLSELTVGDKLHIIGRVLKNGDFRAWVVKDDTIHVTLRVHTGTIATLDAQNLTLTMKEKKNTYTVKADASTKIMIAGNAAPAFSDLKVGDKIHVRGIINNKTKVIAANLIRVGFPLKVAIKVKTPTSTTTTQQTTSALSLQLTSPAFSDNGNIPAEYTCDGTNVNPQLDLANAPNNTKSFALIVDDPDASAGDWVHWTVWNIDSKTTAIAKNSVPAGAVQGINDFGNNNYGGPCPPSGTHRYQFKLYALDAALSLSTSTKKAAIETAMQGHILGRTVLTGKYSK